MPPAFPDSPVIAAMFQGAEEPAAVMSIISTFDIVPNVATVSVAAVPRELVARSTLLVAEFPLTVRVPVMVNPPLKRNSVVFIAVPVIVKFRIVAPEILTVAA